METLKDISFRVKNIKNDKDNTNRYKDIISIFTNEIHNKYSIKELANNSYLISDIMTALYNTEKYEKGINFIDKYLQINLSNLNNEYLAGIYGKCLNKFLEEKYKPSDKWEEDEYEGAENIDDTINSDLISIYTKVKGIIQILNIRDQYSYVTIKLLLFTFLKIISKAKTRWDLGLELLDLINPDLLSKETYTGTFEGKIKEYASDYENWHAKKAKVLFGLGHYNDCIIFSQQTLSANILKHYDYDVWFVRRIALCNYQLKKYDLAIEGLVKVVKYKKDWFVQKELAEAYYSVSYYDKSLKYAIDSMLGRGELKYKWELYYFLYQLLSKMSDMENAIIGLKIAAAIKLKEKWKLGDKLSTCISQNKISLESIDLNTLLKQIQKYALSKLNQGVIKKPNFDTKMGFIDHDGNSIYFRFNVVSGNPLKLKEGDKVYFSSDISYDHKKNRDSVAAVYIKKYE